MNYKHSKIYLLKQEHDHGKVQINPSTNFLSCMNLGVMNRSSQQSLMLNSMRSGYNQDKVRATPLPNFLLFWFGNLEEKNIYQATTFIIIKISSIAPTSCIPA